ncbi:2,3-bisphosphoglycerate-independent phosphoglycerate mutase [Chloroflexota bacterium]
MFSLEKIKDISMQSSSKVVLLVIDGLGGLPKPETGKTELETARTLNLDRLAANGVCGMIDPVFPGITPGSGPGHLALFGYDPFKYNIGRGILEALGIDFDLKSNDVAARGNFCTVDRDGVILDRRAGRLSTEKNAELCRKFSDITINGIKVFVSPVNGHRFVLVLRGIGLAAEVSDSDPQQIGVSPKMIVPLSTKAEKTSRLANEFIAKASVVLADSHPANMMLLRGFARRPNLPTMGELFKLNPAAIAAYPMYRGLSKLVGMKVLDTKASVEETFNTLVKHYDEHDYFFIHVKRPDAAGEDGDFEGKVRALEEVDSLMPIITGLEPDVIVVTGDHSTPALLKAHSWHPVPILLYSQWCRPDLVSEFSESACSQGIIGRFPATAIMPLAMANALKLSKFGA